MDIVELLLDNSSFDAAKYFKDNPITEEMLKFFEERTERHINLVRKYCRRIYELNPAANKDIIARGDAHDASKYKEPEIIPYIYLTWEKKMKADGKEYNLPQEIKDAIHIATHHHVMSNRHHPETTDPDAVINKNDRDKPPERVTDGTKMTWLDLAEMCFTGDTKISLLNGTEVPIKDLVGVPEFWVYSCTPEGEIVPGHGHSARVTKRVSDLCKVTLNNGESIKCTPDHLFMLRDGTYKEAKDLVVGQSLMPLYRKVDNGYESILQNVSAFNEYQLTHQMVSWNILGGYKGRQYCHHCNFDKRNNDPNNLRLVSFAEHGRIHSENNVKLMEKLWKDPKFRETISSSASKTLYKLWKLQDFRKRAATRSGITGKVTGPRNLSIFNKSLKHRVEISKRINKVNNSPVVCDICGRTYANIGGLGTHKKYKHGVVNHFVTEVNFINRHTEVYDITVDNYHNFALSAGVFVHNCADWCAMSEELGGIPQEWADKNINKRWRFTRDQVVLIYNLMDHVWEDKNA